MLLVYHRPGAGSAPHAIRAGGGAPTSSSIATVTFASGAVPHVFNFPHLEPVREAVEVPVVNHPHRRDGGCPSPHSPRR